MNQSCQTMLVNSTSWKWRGCNAIIVEPLKCSKKVNHQSMSDSISLVTGKCDRVGDKCANSLKGVTQISGLTGRKLWQRTISLVMIAIVAVWRSKNCVHCNNSVWRSDKRSSGTSKSIRSVSTRIPRQIILVDGWLSFLGDDCRPSSSNNSWRQAKVKWASAWCWAL